MTNGRDDEALRWDGDDDPTLDAGSSRAPGSHTAPAPEPDHAAEPVALPEGFTAVGRGSDRVERLDAAPTTEGDDAAASATSAQVAAPAQLGNAMLVTLGVVGGVYALYVVGWIIGGLRLAGTAQFLVDPAAYQAFLWLAVVAPLLWFVTVYALTRHSRAWVRVVWLVAGVALFVPWPFLMTGAVGQ